MFTYRCPKCPCKIKVCTRNAVAWCKHGPKSMAPYVRMVLVEEV